MDPKSAEIDIEELDKWSDSEGTNSENGFNGLEGLDDTLCSEDDVNLINLCGGDDDDEDEDEGDNEKDNVDEYDDAKDTNEVSPKDAGVKNSVVQNSSDSEDDNAKSSIEALENLLMDTEFTGPEHAYKQYCYYSSIKGFSVRKGMQRYVGSTKDIIRWKEFLSSSAGIAESRVQSTRVMSFKKFIIRTHCKAKIRVRRLADSVWRITIFENEHNHDLSHVDQSYMLRSSRNLNYEKQSVIDGMTSYGVGVNVACGFMERLCGGVKNLGFTRQDAYDHVKYCRIDPLSEFGLLSEFGSEKEKIKRECRLKMEGRRNILKWNTIKEVEFS